jgi:hypothetical protein
MLPIEDLGKLAPRKSPSARRESLSRNTGIEGTMAILGMDLTKEFRRAGKKSLVLAALFAVGLCIWVPMLWKSVFPRRESSAKDTATRTPRATVESAKPAGEPPAATDRTAADWKRAYRRVEKSNLVQPLALDELVRDPFDRHWIEEKKKPAPSKPESDLAVEHDPNRFLVLSGTLAGDGGAAAIISDYVYRVGEEVPNQGAIRFVLKEIRRDRVVLERSGTLYELQMKDLEQIARDPRHVSPER